MGCVGVNHPMTRLLFRHVGQLLLEGVHLSISLLISEFWSVVKDIKHFLDG